MKNNELHNCDYSDKLVMIDGYPERHNKFYGPAIIRCIEIDGAFYVDNDEYRTQVNFCPYCGVEADIRVKYKDSEEWENELYGM